MNGYLVVLRCMMDDLPLGLFATRAKALKFALNLDFDGELPIERVWGIDRSSITQVDILQFKNGEPVARFAVDREVEEV